MRKRLLPALILCLLFLLWMQFRNRSGAEDTAVAPVSNTITSTLAATPGGEPAAPASPLLATAPTHSERSFKHRERGERGDEEWEREGEEEEDGMMEAMAQEYERTKSPITGEVPNYKLLDAMRERDAINATGRNMAAISGITWTERGPNNVGGRTRSILFDANDVTKKKVWVGSAGGGLWYTNDISGSPLVWNKINDFLDNLAVTSLAQSPVNSQYMYAGTGEGWYNSDAIRGVGIFRSTDGGATWALLPSTGTSTFYYTQKIVVTGTGAVLAATRTGSVQRSLDNGNTWSRVLNIGGASAADIEIGADGTIYASTGILTSGGGIFRSTDNGSTWTQIYTSASDEQRIELACAPTAAGTVYALVQKSDYTFKKMLMAPDANVGVPTWSSPTNPTWCDQGTTRTDFTRGQAWYDLTLTVDPVNPNVVWAGGVDVMRYNATTATWTQLTQWSSGCSGKPQVHADIHVLQFKPGSSTELLVGCDGGIYRTTDGGTTFAARNTGYNVTQYYAVAVHPTDPNYFLAGAQDNGTQKFFNPGLNNTTNASGGDGGFCHIDQDNPTIQITSYVYNAYYVSNNGGASFSSRSKNSNGQFINPWDYDNTNDILYASSSAGTYFRWFDPATNGLSSEISVTQFGTAKVTAVTMSPTVANRVYFGMSNGSVYRVDDANTTPSVTLVRSGSGSVSCVAVNPSNESLMLVTYSNYDITNVYYSSNATAATPTFTGIDGNLPNMPVRWAIFDPRNPASAFLATELGVWSTDAISGAATNWGSTNGGLANVRVDMLKYSPGTQTLAAATHGRGLFTVQLCTSANITTQPAAQALCVGTPATFSVVATGSGLTYQWRKGGGNIAGATSATYTIPSVSAADAGSYDVVISGGCGSVTSGAAALVVNSAAAIGNHPVAQTVCAGNPASFTVNASGAGLGYQWRRNGGIIAGANSATYTIAAASAANTGNYDVVVSGTCGAATSNTAPLALSAATAITAQPAPLTTVCVNVPASFTVNATGTGALSYQWRKNGVDIPGATSSSHSIGAPAVADSGDYSVVVTGACGSQTSQTSVLKVSACTAVSNLDPNVSGVTLSPNPVNDAATLRLSMRSATTTRWTVFDANGREVMQFSRNATPGSNAFPVSFGALASGTYYLVGHSDKGRLAIIRFVRK